MGGDRDRNRVVSRRPQRSTRRGRHGRSRTEREDPGEGYSSRNFSDRRGAKGRVAVSYTNSHLRSQRTEATDSYRRKDTDGSSSSANGTYL